jgi:hypothetical protein
VTEWSRLLQSLLQDIQGNNSLQHGISELNHLIHSTLISVSFMTSSARDVTM